MIVNVCELCYDDRYGYDTVSGRAKGYVTMSRIGIFCADGLEEIECLTVVDYLRRAGIDIEMISITGRRQIMGSHQIHFITDRVFEDVDFDALDGIVLPGGAAGTRALEADEDVCDVVRQFAADGRLTAAISAAPGIFARLGLLDGKKATMYPGMEPSDCGAEWTGSAVERSGCIITGRGPAKVSAFSIELINYLKGSEAAGQTAEAVVL